MIFTGTAASTVVRARSARHAQNAWAKLVDAEGERRAFSQLATAAGGSDAAFRALTRHDIQTDL